MRNENGTESCNGNYFDGEVHRANLVLGRRTKLTFTSEKDVYLPSIRKCRQKPFIDLLNSNLLNNVQQNCARPCKPDDNFSFCYALRLSKGIDQLPMCMTKDDTECFFDNYDVASKSVLRSYSGPCTRLTHRLTSKFDRPIAEDTEAELHVTFHPSTTAVKEEYLIYDMIAMISAIGGTMGLCIGFSFTHFTNTTLTLVTQMVRMVRKG